ncbi:MAG: rhodanese-like domain-containing protein [Pseudomonadota bacterium]
MSYAGDISPKACWDMLSGEDRAVLVDVRTRAEWAYVGGPMVHTDMRAPIGQEWQVFPTMLVDTGFVGALQQQLDAQGATRDTKICFLCRSGVRSLAAAQAMTAHGYTQCFNIAGGFEGDPNRDGHRGHVNGWKAEGLPWRQP